MYSADLATLRRYLADLPKPSLLCVLLGMVLWRPMVYKKCIVSKSSVNIKKLENLCTLSYDQNKCKKENLK